MQPESLAVALAIMSLLHVFPGAHTGQPPAPRASEGDHPGAGGAGPAPEPDAVTTAADARADHREPHTQPKGTMDGRTHARTQIPGIPLVLSWLVCDEAQMVQVRSVFACVEKLCRGKRLLC